MAGVCPNCQAPRGDDDVFCENCGMDFLSGSLPEEPKGAEISEDVSETEPTGSESSSDTSSAGNWKVQLSVEVDRSQYDEVVNEGELAFPSKIVGPVAVELIGSEFHLGRTSESRAIFPDIDLLKLTGDEAVSSRHAVLKVQDNGSVTVQDVGSTNGTTVDAVDTKTLSPGNPVGVTTGQPIFLGAWSKVVVTDVEVVQS